MNRRGVILALLLCVAPGSGAGCASTVAGGSGTWVDDSVINAKVKTALVNESALPAGQISVATLRGTVQLSGFVRSQADMDRAIKVAHGVLGVTSVMNAMRFR